MKFIENVNKEQYEEFVKSNKKSHFLQSYSWGEFCNDAKNMKPHYLGLINDEKKLVATALLLEKKLPFGYTYFYCPRGFVLDYSEQKILKEFTKSISNYVKKYKALFFKIDPDIKLHTIDKNANPIKGENNYELVKCLKSLGFKRKKLSYFFEDEQPRFTFRIDLKNKNENEVISNYSKTARRFIKKSDNYDITVKTGTKKDIKQFAQLMIKTEKRQNFYSHNEEYYEKFYNYFSKDNNVEIMIAKLNIPNTIKLIEEQKKEEINNFSRQEELDFFKEKLKIEKEPIISSYITVFYGNKSWYLYGANDMEYKMTYANYKLFNYQILTAVKRKVDIFDEFGTIGIPESKKKVAGLHEFKKKFGGEYTEFIGEFDYISKPILYFIFTNLISIRRSIIKFINRNKVKSNNK